LQNTLQKTNEFNETSQYGLSLKHAKTRNFHNKLIDYNKYLSHKKRVGSDGFYLIKSGEAMVVNTIGKEKVFTEIRMGDFFGESKIFKRPVSNQI